MPGSKPVLYLFAISHFCEKARWALDYLSIDYELRHVAPGEHRQIAMQLGAPASSVPYLGVGKQVIQGSADIIDWADDAATLENRCLMPAADPATCQMIEQRIDDIAGVHVRRLYYSEALVQYPETVRPLFTRDLPLTKNLLTRIAWGKICKVMIERMDLGMRQGQESRDIVERELDWIDDLLSDGRTYLVDNAFSRADLAVASLLAPLALPPEHPTYGQLTHPPNLAAVVTDWGQRPSLTWTRDMYAQHR